MVKTFSSIPVILAHMRYLLSSCALLLAEVALASSPPTLRVQLECFDAWQSTNLKNGGGGPGGAHWNTETVVCEARLEEAPGADIQSVQFRLEIGQGKALTPAGDLYLPAHPQKTLAMGEETIPVEAIAAVAERTRRFFIPASLLTRTLLKTSRQPETGATVSRARFVLTARGLDAKGRAVATANAEVAAEFAFGE
jgi:hypothetical protein